MTEFPSTKIKERIIDLFQEAGSPIDGDKAAKLTKLLETLCKYNAVHNLTAIRDPMEMVKLHVMDSASAVPFVDGVRIADVGTGAGFPGAVLAVLMPERHFTLIESVGKKVSYLRVLAHTIELKNIEIIHSRVEKYDFQIKFDTIISRAVSSLGDLCRLCLPLVRAEGSIVAMKARLTDEELKELPQSVKIDQIKSVKVPGTDALRQLVILKLAHE